MATANDVSRTSRQRNVAIHHPDFENFDNEMSVEDYDYYSKHKEEFKQMWHDQTLLYWKRLNLNYKAFLVDYGTVYKLRASGPLMNMLLKECWGYLDRQTTKSNDVELVMKLIEDGYILVKSRHLLPFVDVRDKEKCPFLNESTKKTFRRFFGTPKKMGLRLKVWFQYPLYVKYTGALCKFLKSWIKTTEYIEEDTGNYWKLPVKRVLDSYDLDYSVLIGKETKPPWVHPDPNSNMWWDNGGLSTMMFLSPEGPKILARYLDLHIPEYMDKKELEEHKKEQERKAEARRQEEMNIIEFALKKEAEKNKLEKKMEELLVSKVPMPNVSPEKLGRKKPTLPEAVKSKSMQVFKLQKVRRDGYESNEDEDMEDPEQFYKKYEIKAELVDKEPEGEEANTPIGLYMDAAAIRKQQRKLDAESGVKKEIVEDDDEGEVSEERMTYSLLKAQLSKTGAIPKETSNENESQKEKNDSQLVKGNKLKVNGKKPIKIEIDSITNQNARARKNKKITGAAGDTADEKKVHNVTINLPGEGGSQRKVLVTIDGDQPQKSVSGMIWNAPIFKELSFAQKLLSKPDDDDDDDDDPHFMVAKKIMGKKEIDYTKESELEIGSRHLHVLSYQTRLKVVPELRKLINPEEEKMRNKQYRRSTDALKGYGITAVELPHGHVLSSSGWRCDLFMTDDCLEGLVLVKNTKNFGTKYAHKIKSKGRKQRVKAPKNMKKVIREERIKHKKEEHFKAVRLKQEIMRKTWEEEKAVPERRYHSKDNPGADESPFMMYKSLLWDVVANDVRAIRNMIIVLNDTRNDDVNLNALSKEQRQQVEEDKELIGVVVKKITEYKDKQPFVIFPPGMDQMVDIYHAVIMAKMLRESLREQYTVDTVHTPPDRQVVLDTFAQMVPHLAEEVKFEYVQKVKKYYEGKDKYKAFIERKIIQEAERRVQIEGRERGEHVTVEDRMQYTKRPEFQELVYEKLLEGYKNRGEGGKKRHAKDEKETTRDTHSRSDEKEDKKTLAEDSHNAWTSKGSFLTENTMAQVENKVKLFLDKDSSGVSTPEVHSNATASKNGRKETDFNKWAFVRENEETDSVRKSTDAADVMEEVTESKKETNGDVIKQKKPYEFKTCFYCDKVETIRKQFKQCQRCVQMKAKRIRFYCTKECQVNDWKLKHKEQHSTGNFN